MHVLPAMILVEIITIVFLCYNRYNDDMVSLIGGGIGIMLIITILVGITIAPEKAYKKISEEKITTIQDDTYLIAEQPHGKIFYKYQSADNKDKTNSISVTDTKIYESKNNYRIETWKYRKQFLFVYYDNIVYKIYIPSTGNIKYEK